MKGHLAARPLGVLLADLGQSGKSGILSLTRKEIRKQVCLLRGAIRFAASNIRGEGFGPFLVRQGHLDPDTVAGLEAELQPGQRLGPLLAERGTLAPDTLREAARAHIIQILYPCLDWADGQFSFAPGVPNIAGEIHVEVAPLELALERGRHREDPAVQSRLKLNRRVPLRRGGDKSVDLSRLRLTQAEARIVEAANEQLPVEGAVARAESEAEGLLALAALLEAGIVELASAEDLRETASRGAAGDASGPRLTQAEERTLAHYKDILVASEGADHYQILSVAVNATEEDVRHAYYRLARDLHPDRFAAPPLDILRSQMEVLFARITEAYNVLSNPTSRADYDAWRAPAAPPQSGAPAPPEVALPQNPRELARLNYMRGKGLVEQQKFYESLKFLENAVSLDPTRPEYLVLLGRVQARNPRQRQEAIATLTSAARHDPTNVRLRLDIVRLCRRGGEDEAAERWLREILRIEPDNAEAREELGEKASGGLLRGIFGRGERK